MTLNIFLAFDLAPRGRVASVPAVVRDRSPSTGLPIMLLGLANLTGRTGRLAGCRTSRPNIDLPIFWFSALCRMAETDPGEAFIFSNGS